MRPERAAAVDALRRPLQLAQRNAKIPSLAVALRLACDRLLALARAAAPDAALLASVAALAAWRQALADFESWADPQRRQAVDEGLAHLARLAVELAREDRGAAEDKGAAAAAEREPVGARGVYAPVPAGAGRALPQGRLVSASMEPKPGPRSSASAAPLLAAPSAATPARLPAATPTRLPAATPTATPARTPAATPASLGRKRTAAAKAPPVAAGTGTTPAPAAKEPSPPGAGATAAPSSAKAKAKVAAKPPPNEDPLAAPTSALRGIGPAFAARLAGRNLSTVEDLLWLVPRRYDDLRTVPSLAEVLARPRGPKDEPAAVVGALVAVVRSVRMVFARGRRWAEARLAAPEDPKAPPALLVRWFGGHPGIEQRLPAGSKVVLSGSVRVLGAARAEMANPEIVEILAEGGAPAPRIASHYPMVRGVPPTRLRAACALACERVGSLVDDGVPASAERGCELPALGESLAVLHAPPVSLEAELFAALVRGDSPWHRRLAFGELFALAAAVALRRAHRRGDRAPACPDPDAATQVAAVVPFPLTAAQRRAIAEIGRDLAAEIPMNRLLEGDVGAGKTLVALAAAVQAARAGNQVALMAPTSVLAEQHAASWRGVAAALGLRVALLTAATPRPEAATLTAALARGELDVVVGTHALLSEGVAFARLALCIIDEQHRFGVAQRVALRDKGPSGTTPHLLVMTATPIPRTLALTAYGDLELSILDELPPGREPAKTRVLRGARGEADALRVIASRVAAGERAFVVCPKIGPAEDAGLGYDEDDDEPWRDAQTVAAELGAALPRVGLVHGRLDPAARDAVMRDFRDGRLSVLVATTVIEVGVDVPEATVMAIFDADRFGLSQLHQLRGRVGRGGGKSHCLLLVRGATTEEGARRLEVMTETSDGFRIAEEDLRLRGPGEVLGARQAGVPRLRFGDLSQHTALLLQARRAAEAVLEQDPRLARPEHAGLARALRRRLEDSDLFGAESG
ncbi:MAG: ATP-dependent DNA helicase RecG [Myxococcales bacterium]|nr:ATP-dependent DNA helicase RecG [Myxococcales bacterium]